MNVVYNIGNDQQYQLLLTLKVRQLHSNGFTGISYDDLHHILINHKWKRRQPTRLSEIADDILHLNEDEIVRWLAVDSRVKGYSSSLDDYRHLIEKEEL
ncbi:post-transcriptional regulator [Erysipelothrix sp. HDW6A]|uniref:post-transcriptional regulator n=1 Tax=Erysipelothrix sp. HDW6A TaxID=2714928 RepID=UPI001F115B08|nr:post-transcriptional regulator [Erysipelothrix sp. HDW6A]